VSVHTQLASHHLVSGRAVQCIARTKRHRTRIDQLDSCAVESPTASQRLWQLLIKTHSQKGRCGKFVRALQTAQPLGQSDQIIQQAAKTSGAEMGWAESRHGPQLTRHIYNPQVRTVFKLGINCVGKYFCFDKFARVETLQSARQMHESSLFTTAFRDL
jgi:hypothetical protein